MVAIWEKRIHRHASPIIILVSIWVAFVGFSAWAHFYFLALRAAHREAISLRLCAPVYTFPAISVVAAAAPVSMGEWIILYSDPGYSPYRSIFFALPDRNFFLDYSLAARPSKALAARAACARALFTTVGLKVIPFAAATAISISALQPGGIIRPAKSVIRAIPI